MEGSDHLDRGRSAYAQQAWADAFKHLSAADEQSPLGMDDLECLATAAYLMGNDAEWTTLLARAYQDMLHGGNATRAARCAFWLGFGLLDLGEVAQGSGWLARAGRVLDDYGQDCVERGYLLVPSALEHLEEGDAAAALDIFQQASEIAGRFGDTDLIALTTLGRGQSLIGLGKTRPGSALLDEVMIAVTADEVSPIIVGVVYCAVIETFHRIFDLGRAQEWTASFSRWCEAQPDLVPYRGQCLIHRAEIMQFQGDWRDAMDEARRARDRFSRPPVRPAIGMALYRLAELHRLHGEFTKAEDAYREASRWGRRPQPGLSLLRLAQGRVDDAGAAIRRSLDEAEDRAARSLLLSASVEIMLAAGDLPAARVAADELSELAASSNTPFLEALAAQAVGAVSLAEGDARGALTILRGAWTAWRDLEMPYEAGRARVLIGLAYRELGANDDADMELDAARWIFQQLGAASDLAAVQDLLHAPMAGANGLTGRELQVLTLAASGKTNRAIAVELVISEKTVARHMSNIFTKLGLSSRSAATAYAYEHDLV
jgi:DNA-binding CsgD family transcriptional regulator